jgi:hypothetical protein
MKYLVRLVVAFAAGVHLMPLFYLCAQALHSASMADVISLLAAIDLHQFAAIVACCEVVHSFIKDHEESVERASGQTRSRDGRRHRF